MCDHKSSVIIRLYLEFDKSKETLHLGSCLELNCLSCQLCSFLTFKKCWLFRVNHWNENVGLGITLFHTGRHWQWIQALDCTILTFGKSWRYTGITLIQAKISRSNIIWPSSKNIKIFNPFFFFLI